MYLQLVEFFTEDYLFMKYQDKDIIAEYFWKGKILFLFLFVNLKLNQPVFRFIMLKCIVQMSL